MSAIRFSVLSFAAVVATAAAGAQAPQTAPQGLAWARIPAGTFQMGCGTTDTRCDADERPRHPVTLTRAYDMMTTEVTVGMYQTVITSLGEQPPWSTTPEHPVTIVSWNDALAFCEAIGGRLPSEAEWERAARGSLDDTVYAWGDQEPDDRPGSANGAAFEGDSARPVKTFAANGYGLYDMAGNTWEWVATYFDAYGPDPIVDPTGPIEGRIRVIRGGSYGDDSRNLRVSNRNGNPGNNEHVNVGFRCARDAE